MVVFHAIDREMLSADSAPGSLSWPSRSISRFPFFLMQSKMNASTDRDYVLKSYSVGV